MLLVFPILYNFLCYPRRQTTYCRKVYTFVNNTLSKMKEEHLWMRRMNYNICVLCPICSKNWEQAFKCVHGIRKCKQEKCLHYVKEEEVQSKGTLRCNKPMDTKKKTASTKMFAPWFEALDKKVRTT